MKTNLYFIRITGNDCSVPFIIDVADIIEKHKEVLLLKKESNLKRLLEYAGGSALTRKNFYIKKPPFLEGNAR